MKTIFKLNALKKLISIIVLPFLLWNCEGEEIIVNELNSVEHTAIIQHIISNNIKGIPFPKNSKLLRLDNEQSKIVLPEDVYFVVKYINGKKVGDVELITEMSVRCTCTQGTGCSPVSYDGNYYCVMNEGCNTCKMRVSDSDNEEIEIAGIMDERSPVKFISNVKSKFTTQEKLNLKYHLNEDFFKNKEIKKQLNNLYKVIYGKNIPDFITYNSTILPKNYSYTKVDFYGNKIFVPIPTQLSIEEEYIEIIDDGKVTCKCNRGVAGCKLKSFLGAKYCDAGSCSDCTLND